MIKTDFKSADLNLAEIDVNAINYYLAVAYLIRFMSHAVNAKPPIKIDYR